MMMVLRTQFTENERVKTTKLLINMVYSNCTVKLSYHVQITVKNYVLTFLINFVSKLVIHVIVSYA